MMPLSDLIQWIETSRHSGTLMADNQETSRHFYFQDGKLIFVWSDNEGERFCGELQKQMGLTPEQINETMAQAQRLGLSLVGLLSCNEGIRIEKLSGIMSKLAERSLSKTLTWKTGQFHFADHTPAAVLSSPVSLHTSQILLESAIQLDERGLEAAAPLDPVINEIIEQIDKGTIDIPPMPSEMQVLMSRISVPELSIEEIIECITDPLLVSKVLRICNSSFYGLRGKVGTMRDAVVYIGLKALTSIVTVHALSGYSTRNTEQVQTILHHSLMVGMIAKQLARDLRMNHDQAFVCGLLHDLGRVVMLELLEGYQLSPRKRDLLVEQHHTTVGGLVAERWNFSEEILETIRFHHNPSNAREHCQLVEIIQQADLIARNEAPSSHSAHEQGKSSLGGTTQPFFSDHLDELDREIEAILSPV